MHNESNVMKPRREASNELNATLWLKVTQTGQTYMGICCRYVFTMKFVDWMDQNKNAVQISPMN